MQDKIKIEHGSVQETLIIPLYARKMCVDLFPNVFYDPAAPELCARLDYDFSSLDKKAKSTAYQFGALEGAMRQLDMAWEVNDYLATHPDAAERFPGGKLVFDAVNRFGQKMMMKTILRNFDMGDYTELFSVQSIDELRAWSPSLTISQRPYMLGYNDMRDPSIKGIHRVLAKVGDKLMGMTIYRIDFLA